MDALTFFLLAFCLVCIIGIAMMYIYASKKCHHKWGPLENSGHQYCNICGSAKLPCSEGNCLHQWLEINKETITTTSSSGSRKTGYIYVLKCEKCGDITSREIKISGT